jgi:hypothetical protein
MKLFNLTGKVAIVTGGNGGIGLGMAEGMGAMPPRRRPRSKGSAKQMCEQPS